VIGSGPDLPAAGRVHRLPFQSNPARLASLVGACDLLVHPGDQETFGMVVLEAMACGIPVLGTAAGGVAELVDDEVGMLVAANDAGALAEGIAAIYRRDLRALGMRARARMLAQYDWNVVMPQVVRHYARLTGRPDLVQAVEEMNYAID